MKNEKVKSPSHSLLACRQAGSLFLFPLNGKAFTAAAGPAGIGIAKVKSLSI